MIAGGIVGKRMVSLCVITVALAALGSGQTRDEPDDSRWTPWLGCWTPAQREVFTEEQQTIRLRRVSDDGGADAQPALGESD
jgi:hypothetical protein